MVSYPEDWNTLKINDVFKTITDFVAAGSFKNLSDNVNYYDSPKYAQLIRTKDIRANYTNKDFVYIDKHGYDYLWRVHFDSSKIIMPNIGNCGEVYLVEPQDLPNSRCALGPNAIMLSNTNNRMDYVYYYLQTDDFQEKLKNIISPNGQTKFNKTELGQLEITIPSDTKEQIKIAKNINYIAQHIVYLSKLIKKKKMIRDGALEDLMTGRTRLDGFDSEWEVSKFSKSLVILNGDRGINYPSDADIKSYGIPFVNAGNIHNGKIKLEEMEFISLDLYQRLGGGKLQRNDILFCLRGSIGKFGIVEFDKGAPASSLCIIRCNKNIFYNYLYYYLYSDFFNNQLNNLITGSSQPNLSAKDLKNISISIPKDIKEQEAIADILATMDKEIEDLKKELDKVKQIKEAAMNDLLTGRIRLK